MLIRCKTNPGENWGVDFVFDLDRVVSMASFPGGVQVQLEGGGGRYISVSVGLEELLALWKVAKGGRELREFGGPVVEAEKKAVKPVKVRRKR